MGNSSVEWLRFKRRTLKMLVFSMYYHCIPGPKWGSMHRPQQLNLRCANGLFHMWKFYVDLWLGENGLSEVNDTDFCVRLVGSREGKCSVGLSYCPRSFLMLCICQENQQRLSTVSTLSVPSGVVSGGGKLGWDGIPPFNYSFYPWIFYP